MKSQEKNTKNSWFKSRSACPACTSKNFVVIYTSPYTQSLVSNYLVNFYKDKGKVEFEYLQGVDYTLCECKNCGLIFQKNIPSEKLTERIYNCWIDPRRALEKHRKTCLKECLDNAQEINRILEFTEKEPQRFKCLDFGMGWGHWALTAKAFGCNSFGTEISQERLKYARSIGVKTIDINELPPRQLDFINAEQVFEHIAEPLQELGSLSTFLKPGGIIKISVPTAVGLKYRLKKLARRSYQNEINFPNPVAPLEHINLFTRTALSAMAQLLGLKEITMPLRIQYRYITSWKGAKRVVKNLLFPIYRNILKKQNYVFLQKENGGEKLK